jgi:hypothetical protein
VLRALEDRVRPVRRRDHSVIRTRAVPERTIECVDTEVPRRVPRQTVHGIRGVARSDVSGACHVLWLLPPIHDIIRQCCLDFRRLTRDRIPGETHVPDATYGLAHCGC